MATKQDPLEKVQSLIDDALRSEVKAIAGTYEAFEDDEALVASPDQAILGDWLMVMQWIDPGDGKSFYFRLNSRGVSPHARAGLASMIYEMER